MSDVKTVLTRNYYIIKKKKFDNSLLNEIREDLTVKPFVKEEYGGTPNSFPIYLESQKKIYIPKHYGIEKFGEPNLVKIGKGDSINIEFNGSLRPKQIPIVETFTNKSSYGTFCLSASGLFHLIIHSSAILKAFHTRMIGKRAINA